MRIAGKLYLWGEDCMIIFMGLLGMFLFLCALFDVEWFMRMTRGAHHGYPFGRMFTRILVGTVGLFWMWFAIAEILSR
jgi:hypothetical protein